MTNNDDTNTKIVPNTSWIFIYITESAFSKTNLILMKSILISIIIPFLPDVETQIQKCYLSKDVQLLRNISVIKIWLYHIP